MARVGKKDSCKGGIKIKIELSIENKGVIYSPIVSDSIVFSTERKGSPSELKFSVLKDNTINFTEGNPVSLKIDGKNVFFGFVFTKKRDKEDIISVIAYDQLRYLKNKDTYVYSNNTASELIKKLAGDFGLQTGDIEDTGYKIKSRIEENTTIYDMIQNALDITLDNKKEIYVLYDDFGKIALKNIKSMQLDILIDEETGENFSYSSSIDNDTYNKIKLTYDNEETSTREVFIAKDSKNINSWGVLQYFDTLQDGENGKAKADALLKLYNSKTRTLSVSNAFGDIRARAGCLIGIKLNLGDIIQNNLMLIEKCKHTFKNGEHFMDLTLTGGEFIA